MTQSRYARLPDRRKVNLAKLDPKYAADYVLEADGKMLTPSEWYATWTPAERNANAISNLKDLIRIERRKPRNKGFSEMVRDPFRLTALQRELQTRIRKQKRLEKREASSMK